MPRAWHQLTRFEGLFFSPPCTQHVFLWPHSSCTTTFLPSLTHFTSSSPFFSLGFSTFWSGRTRTDGSYSTSSNGPQLVGAEDFLGRYLSCTVTSVALYQVQVKVRPSQAQCRQDEDIGYATCVTSAHKVWRTAFLHPPAHCTTFTPHILPSEMCVSLFTGVVLFPHTSPLCGGAILEEVVRSLRTGNMLLASVEPLTVLFCFQQEAHSSPPASR